MSLFAKLLLWFLATVIISVSGFALILRLRSNDGRDIGPVSSRIVQHFADQAGDVFQKSGVDGLRAHMERFRDTTGLTAFFLDQNGKDVLDGSDQSDLLRHVRKSNFLASPHQARLLAGRVANAGPYTFVVFISPRFTDRPLFIQQHLWWMLVVVLFTYLLARHLTVPVRKLEAAAESLGSGDLKARAPTGRKDELGRLAASFNQMAERIESLVESDRRLLRDVSHELRSPLARLGVAVELARSSDNPDRELDVIQQQADRLNALVGTLLDVSRAEVSPDALRRQPVALDHLLTEVVEEARIEANQLKRTVSLATDRVQMTGDPELIRRAVENVLRNAIRYTPEGGNVEVNARRKGTGVLLSIRDHGPGVPIDSLPHLFEAFYRVGGQHTAGFGLGLSIAKRAVSLHKGSISAHNAEPGLEVDIELPVT